MVDELEFLEGILMSRIKEIKGNEMYPASGLNSQVSTYEDVLKEIKEIKQGRVNYNTGFKKKIKWKI